MPGRGNSRKPICELPAAMRRCAPRRWTNRPASPTCPSPKWSTNPRAPPIPSRSSSREMAAGRPWMPKPRSGSPRQVPVVGIFTQVFLARAQPRADGERPQADRRGPRQALGPDALCAAGLFAGRRRGTVHGEPPGSFDREPLGDAGLAGARSSGRIPVSPLRLARPGPPGRPIEPEVAALGTLPVVCLYGADEAGESLCSLPAMARHTVRAFKGGHHFASDYDGVAAALLAGMGLK